MRKVHSLTAWKAHAALYCEFALELRCQYIFIHAPLAHISNLLSDLRTLRDAQAESVLVPAGQWYMFIPALHFVVAGRQAPVHLGPGT